MMCGSSPRCAHWPERHRPAATAALVDLWLDLPRDPARSEGVDLQEIAAYESR
ncbi:hypothetical protein [Ornithinimicrobium sp. W1665]|uniref:hypothetical protein n=1 Tax=Ornithinimicrobium sp. W1665 TaxID=3416666 RepID=UPI003D6A22AC